MAYSELIKNFSKIREYMRQFYVFGFRKRGEYTAKSARSYDDERRRIASWLGDWMKFTQTSEGRSVFLSIDTRNTRHNPLYKAWKTKSFTDLDITLHFLIFDILYKPGLFLTLSEITDRIDEQLAFFSDARRVDTSTVRKKLREYEKEGLVEITKKGKSLRYSRTADAPVIDPDALDYFSEAAPVGVIGSFLLDRQNEHPGRFSFKHHYITSTLDSEVICGLLSAMGEKRYVDMEVSGRRREKTSGRTVVPLQLFVSVQNGRTYLAAFVEDPGRVAFFRTDNVLSVKEGEVCPAFDSRREELEEKKRHMWGVSTRIPSGEPEHVEFTVRYAPDEGYIHDRLEREKRIGKVERISAGESRFSRDVYDAWEMVPWIRTFICRITDIHFSNERLRESFKADLERMYAMYREGGDSDAVQ